MHAPLSKFRAAGDEQADWDCLKPHQGMWVPPACSGIAFLHRPLGKWSGTCVQGVT